MFGRSFKKARSGQKLAPRTLNQPITETERQSKMTASPPFAIQDSPNGPLFNDSSELPIYIKLTSGSGAGPYAWTAQYFSSAAFHDGVQTGTSTIDPAYNSTGTTPPSLPYIVLASRQDGVLTFSAGSC